MLLFLTTKSPLSISREGTDGPDAARKLGEWPLSPEKSAILFEMAYDAAAYFWKPMVARFDGDGAIAESPRLEELKAMTYADGSKVLKDACLPGWRLVREVLRALGDSDDRVFRSCGMIAGQRRINVLPQIIPSCLPLLPGRWRRVGIERMSSMQRVFVVPHEPGWIDKFAEEAAAVGRATGDVLIEIHHIGSTAIPGICAKPIIDILAVVNDLDRLDELNPHLQELGYEAMGEFGISGRRYFRKNDEAGNRTHQIHAFQVGSPQIARHVNFRDFLRAHREYAEQYDALKRQLATLHPFDISAYIDGKDAFIQEVDAKAAVWRGR